MINYRNYHEETHAHNWQMKIEPVAHGLKVTAYEGATPFHLLSDRAEATPRHDWYRRYFLMREANRGLNAIEDHLAAGSFQVALQPGETKTVKFTLTPEELSLWDINMKWVVEPGEFEIMTGNSSRDGDIKKVVLTVM
ncbi:MAG: glycogen debranching enzyme N-terminal domain-containing protein [Saprospiraceae bacterium]|nr:glycogen debranching enzyme N-terminal domain-containing protein [Saprospiraceae bacterium]